ncbi:MAG: putative O-glycosylation ligase, exosortase A system-associated, partial [Gammaproteobacteria bacterium]|nr:putative O-glycosylation ligase, exosortase A system-associated [Gammaproteobacteria bacterium]
MRSLIVTLMVFSSLPLILARPHIGVLVWSWLGYMNPHRLAWGFAYNFPFSQVVAGTLIVSLIFSPEKKRLPITPLTVVWMVFLGWICVTTFNAMYPEAALEMFDRVVKIQLVVFITMMVINTRQRVEQLLWVIVFSLGFFGVKGGAFKILTGGSALLFGPGGFISDNNALAIALLMTLPLMNYLRMVSDNKTVRWVMLVCMLLVAAAIISTFSRAAALGGVAVAFLIWAKSDKKLITAFAVLMMLPLLYIWAPQSWHDRMATITQVEETGEREVSAQSRIDVWKMIINLSKDRPVLGAGLDPWFPETYDRYAPEPERIEKAWAAHSIYFSVLAEHGFPGLVLFLLIYMLAWRTARRIERICKPIPEADWLVRLSSMLQVSMAGFAVAGAFHQLPYFDLPWHIIGILVVCEQLAKRYVSSATESEVSPQPAAGG